MNPKIILLLFLLLAIHASAQYIEPEGKVDSIIFTPQTRFDGIQQSKAMLVRGITTAKDVPFVM